MAIPRFSAPQLKKICDVIADAASHAEHTQLLKHQGVQEQGGQPKWQRLQLALSARQDADRCGNNVGAYIQAVMAPVRFTGRTEEFTNLRRRLNEVLAFARMQLGEDGMLRPDQGATTLTEAVRRADELRAELTRRRVHADVLRFCRPELVEHNYFHAVLEATKSVADKIRARTGRKEDGAGLVDVAFGAKTPLLAVNTLRSQSEQSEQIGFANMLKGVFGVFRNPIAHDPKIHRIVSQEDALDAMSMLSFIHRRLDAAVPTRPGTAAPIP